MLSFQKGHISSLCFHILLQILQYSGNSDFFHLCSIISLFKGLTGLGSSHIPWKELTSQYLEVLIPSQDSHANLAHKIEDNKTLMKCLWTYTKNPARTKLISKYWVSFASSKLSFYCLTIFLLNNLVKTSLKIRKSKRNLKDRRLGIF